MKIPPIVRAYFRRYTRSRKIWILEYYTVGQGGFKEVGMPSRPLQRNLERRRRYHPPAIKKEMHICYTDGVIRADFAGGELLRSLNT